MGEEQRQVWLNGVRLPIIGAVAWQRITPFPSQFTTTAPRESDYTPVRRQRWGSLKGGLGKDKWDSDNNNRYSDGSLDTSQEVAALPPLATTLGTFGADVKKIGKYKGRIWGIGHRQISYWTGSAWTSVKTDFDNPTDMITYYGVQS